MNHKITIPCELADMNEIVKLAKRSPFAYSKLKKDNTNICAWASKKLPKMERIRLKITYICKDKKKDPDNIAVAKKFILDGLVAAGVIENDGWGQIAGWTEEFEVDKKNPRIEIEIEEETI